MQRVLRGAPASLTVVLADQDGSPADAAGVVTVTVAQADGTVVLPAGTPTVHGLLGSYSVALSAAQTAQLALLTATWTDAGNGRTVTSSHEVAGGFFFSLADARNSNDGLLADPVKYPDAAILTARQEVEEEAERICDVAFVPRYARAIMDGIANSELILPGNRIRSIRSVRVYQTTGAAAFTALTAVQLAGLVADEDGLIHRTDFGYFPDGRGNIVIEWEHGWDAPPADVRRAALTRLRSRLNLSKTAVNERATTFTGENGQTYKLSVADAFRTGIPDVDAAYQRWSYRDRGGEGPRPASRALNLDPQRYSIFHSGVR